MFGGVAKDDDNKEGADRHDHSNRQSVFGGVAKDDDDRDDADDYNDGDDDEMIIFITLFIELFDFYENKQCIENKHLDQNLEIDVLI